MLKVAFFNAKPYEKPFFQAVLQNPHEWVFIADPLTEETVKAARGCDAVCCFVMDTLNAAVLGQLQRQGIRLIALRSAGYDHVDLSAAKALKLHVVNVPSYSAASIAEFTIAMILALSRKLLTAHERIWRGNFSLEGQLGFNLDKKTVGIIGTGQIGRAVARLLIAFGCTVLAYDPVPSEVCQQWGVTYTSLMDIYQKSDIITLHAPLTAESRHMINAKSLAEMQQKAIVINTGRGALIDTRALIEALKNKKIAAAGLDVYEYEQGLFFADHSQQGIHDALFLELQSLPNVLVTGHQAYFTQEALTNIAQTTVDNLTAFSQGNLQNVVV